MPGCSVHRGTRAVAEAAARKAAVEAAARKAVAGPAAEVPVQSGHMT